MFMKYFEKFSSKNCCYDDIKFYLDLLNELEIQEVGKVHVLRCKLHTCTHMYIKLFCCLFLKLLSKMSDHVKDCHIDYNCEEKNIKPNVRHSYESSI